MTKAGMLDFLQDKLSKSRVEKLFYFKVDDWYSDRQRVINTIKKKFRRTVIVRSSAPTEDCYRETLAGHYSSFLNVDPQSSKQIINTVDAVVSCYKRSDGEETKHYQILIQNQTEDITVCGVIFTRMPENNTPYYEINYSRTHDSTKVTSGQSSFRIDILKSPQCTEIPENWRHLIDAVKEIELLLPSTALDIEFAINKNGEIIIFQVRPLYLKSQQKFNDQLFFVNVTTVKEDYLQQTKADSGYSYLSDMAFWNPSEIIGPKPRPLAYSLYSDLILNSKWNEGLVPLGYSQVDKPLMIRLGVKPYISLPYSFFSLLPDGVPNELKIKLVNFYIEEVSKHPHLHDKIEFKISDNCYDFNREIKNNYLLKHGFTKEEINQLTEYLLHLTRSLINNHRKIFNDYDEDISDLKKRIAKLQLFQDIKHLDTSSLLKTANMLFSSCKVDGTGQFAAAARMAFIAKSLIFSLPINESIKDTYLKSIHTVASQFQSDIDMANDTSIGLIQKTYGHLRPGTYDIRSQTYANQKYFLTRNCNPVKKINAYKKDSTQTHEILIKAVLENSLFPALNVNVIELLHFINEAISKREEYKFEFTRSVSMGLELLAEFGKRHNLSRDQMSYLSIGDIFKSFSKENDLIQFWKKIIKINKKKQFDFDQLSYPQLILSSSDFYCVKHISSVPNYITHKKIVAPLAHLDRDDNNNSDLDGKIIVIQKADPGYDWIFTHNIAGLVTEYGGMGSHMAIRCNELDIPAAIGVGNIIYSRASRSTELVLDCQSQQLEWI